MMIGVRIAFAFEKYDMVTFNNSNFLNYYQCQCVSIVSVLQRLQRLTLIHR